MSRDTRSKAERQSDKEWAKGKLLHYLARNEGDDTGIIYAIRVNRTRTGRESWEFLTTDIRGGKAEIVKISLFLARFLGMSMDTTYGGVSNCDPSQLVYHLGIRFNGNPSAFTLFKL